MAKATTPTRDPRVPETWDTVLADLAGQYIQAVDEITVKNEEWRQAEEQASENVWTQNKALQEAKKLARPEDDSDADATALELVEAYEAAWEAVATAKGHVAKYISELLGVELQAEKPQRDETEVKRLKEQVRGPATEIAKNLMTIAGFTSTPGVTDQIQDFLKANPLPQVGRDGFLDLTETRASAPKYRVDVTASRDGDILFSGDKGKGFTKAAQSAKTFHEKDKAPTAEDFRNAWEAAGKKNTTFEHNGVTYTLSERV